jgi:putative ABC transport system permease protein
VQNIRTVWEKFVPGFPLEINYVSDQVNAMYRNDRTLAKTMNVFSILSLMIASAGLFTLTVLTMNRRVREIGIRKVIGAGIPDIMTSLVKDYFIWISIAFVIAAPLSWSFMTRWLNNFAYRTDFSWWMFSLSGISAMAIALLTVTWKCWQAARKNPVETLRYE